jgi:putative transposase
MTRPKKEVVMNEEAREHMLALLQGDEAIKRLLETTIQNVLEAEMEETLGAGRGERTSGRRGYRSGYYTRNLVTRVGTLELRVPQDRQGLFQTEVFKRYQRSERALLLSLAEMYVQGVSTRKVKAVTEQLCGHAFSASTVSEAAKQLDAELERVMRRPLEEAYPYLILDARYERVGRTG